MSYTIRTIQDGELEAARALTLAVYEYYADVMPPSAWAALRKAISAGLADTSAATHLVAVTGDTLIGSVLLFPPSGGDRAGVGGRMVWPELRMLAVVPQARGGGVGAALVQGCIAAARAAGYQSLGLYTSSSMGSAIALYERLGFVRVPEYDFQPPGAELVTAYRLDLGAAA